MNQNVSTIPSTILLTMLGGATLACFAAAFTTTKTGKDVQNRLLALAGRFDFMVGQSDQTDDETVQVALI